MLIANAALYYIGQTVESFFSAARKIYGRNMWLLTEFRYDHGSFAQEILDTKGQYRKLTVTQVSSSSNLAGALATSLLPNANGVSDYDPAQTYTISFWLRTSLDHIRLYVYFGAIGSASNQIVYRQINAQPNVWQQVVFAGLIPPTSNGTASRSLLGVRLNQGEFATSLIGHTVEIKDVKFELGGQSSYTYHPSLF